MAEVTKITIKYPYMPAGRVIEYVTDEDVFMKAAKQAADELSLDKHVPDGAVIVREGVILGRGANGSSYHDDFGCERVRLGIPTGQQYELCDGCSPTNHGEPSAIADAVANGHDTKGADLYLWGHWWCCQPCWEAMGKAGIRDVYLLAGSEDFFNKDSIKNILPKHNN